MILSAILNFLSKIFLFTGRLTNKNAFLKPLSLEKEKELFEKYRTGDKNAEEELIKHNLRLVAHIVKKYKNTNLDQDELISVGSIGLLKAIKSFDYAKGNSFSTYSARCIQNEILMLIRSQKKFNNQVSLEDKIGSDKEGNEICLLDVLQDTSYSVEDKVQTKLMYNKIIEIIDKCLNKREKEIIYLRFGIDGDIPLTQNEVANILGISRSYISRIEKKAINTLKQTLKTDVDKF